MATKRKIDDVAADERRLFRMLQETTHKLAHFQALTDGKQKRAFEVGETYAMLKLFEWMMKTGEAGRALTVSDIFEHLQSKLSCWIPGLDMPEVGDFGNEPNASKQQQVGPPFSSPLQQQLGPSSSSAPNSLEDVAADNMNVDGVSEKDN